MRTLAFLHAALWASASATTGSDVSRAVTEEQWSCLRRNSSASFAVVRAWRSTGTADPAAGPSIIAAHAAGVPHVDAYLFPCVSCGDPAGQVKGVVSDLAAKGADFGMLWLDIEDYKWPADKEQNQQFVMGLVSAAKGLGVSAGVYTSHHSWSDIVGAEWANASQAGLPLWYPHYDGNPSFSDFAPFGGWVRPAIKQYLGSVTTGCGPDVDLNYYPDGYPGGARQAGPQPEPSWHVLEAEGIESAALTQSRAVLRTASSLFTLNLTGRGALVPPIEHGVSQVAVPRQLDASAVEGAPARVVVSASAGSNVTVGGEGGASCADGPCWTTALPGCLLSPPPPGVDAPVLALSDDGSTTALACSDRLVTLNATTGAILATYHPNASRAPAGPPLRSSVSLSRDGAHAAWSLGPAVHIIESASGTPRVSPVARRAPGHAVLCPMGVFLAYGDETSATVLRYAPTKQAYAPALSVPAEGWRVTSAATSVNGGGGSPDGCLCAFAWAGGEPPLREQSRLTVHSMLTQHSYVDWRSGAPGSAPSALAAVPPEPSVRMHMGAAAMGLPAAAPHAPTVLLFSVSNGSAPVLSFAARTPTTSVDLRVSRGAANESTALLLAAGGGAAGGGDAYAWEVAL